MTGHDHADTSGGLAQRRPYRAVSALAVLVALGLLVVWLTVVQAHEDPAALLKTFAARRGPLTVRVLEAGALKAKDPEIIRSSVRRRAAIISIVPEGTVVKKGDLLVELDVSEMVDHCVDHRIMVTNARAAWIQAREALIIAKSLARSEVEAAQLAYDFAKLDLEKYQGEGGQYATDLAKAQGNIALNQQEVEKNRDYYEWSKKLAQERYLSDTQLKTDALTLRRSELSLEVAENSRTLLEKYTHQRQLVELVSDVGQKKAALARAQAKARATVVQAEARLAACEQAYRRHAEMLAMHEEEVRQSKLYAPTDGTVIYATSGGGHFWDDRQPLADGVMVWNRQELIYLQRSSKIVAELNLHEANLQKVHVGLPALVTVEALPGREFLGTVAHITPLPNPQSMWMNPDLKLYKTEIALEANEPRLRSGMNCRAEIIVDQQEDAICVPVQTVVRVGSQPTVYVLDEEGRTEERRVEIGSGDNTMIRIVSGLSEGEQVLLEPPVPDETTMAGATQTMDRGAQANDLAQQIQERLAAVDEPRSTVWPRPHAGPEPQSTQ
jgi:HlyD family secretion protein